MNPTFDQCANLYIEGYVNTNCFLTFKYAGRAEVCDTLQFPRFDVSPSMQAMGAKLLRTRLRKAPRAGLPQHTLASLK